MSRQSLLKPFRVKAAVLTLLLTLGFVDAQAGLEGTTLKATQVYQGHMGEVEGLAFSPDNTQVFVLAGDTGYVLDAVTYKVVRSFPVIAPTRSTPQWTAQGTLQLSGNGHIVTLDMQSGKVLNYRQYLAESISDVYLSENGLAAVADAQEIKLFDASTGTRTRSVYTGEEYLRYLALNRSGDRLAFNSFDTGASLINSDTGDRVRLLAGNDEFPDGLAFTADGTQIALSKGLSLKPVLNVYDSTDGSLAYAFTGVRDTFSTLQFSPQGQWLAAVKYGDVNLFSTQEHRLKYRLDASGLAGTKLAFSGNDATLAYGTWFGDIHFASTEAGRVVKELKGLPGASQWCAVLSPDGKRVMTCGYDRTARIYDTLTGTSVLTLSGFPAWVRSAVFLPQGNSIATASENSVTTWSGTGKQLKSWPTGDSGPDHLSAHPGGKFVAYDASNYSTGRNAVLVLNVETGVVAARLDVGSRSVARLAFSPDGKTLAGVDNEGRVTLWDWSVRKERVSATVGSRYGEVLSFDPKGQTLAVDSPLGGIQLLDARDLKKGRFFRRSEASAAQFSRSGNKLVVYSGSGKAAFSVFDARTGALLGSYATEVGGAFMLTPDGKSLLVEGGKRGQPINATMLTSADGSPVFR